MSLAQLILDYPVHAGSVGAFAGSLLAGYVRDLRRKRILRTIIREELGPILVRLKNVEELHRHSHPHMRVHHAKGT